MLQIKSSLAHCWLLSPQRTGMEKLHMVLLRRPMQARTFFWNLNNWPFIKQWINSFNFFLYNDQMCMWWQNKGLLHKGPASCAAVNLTGGPAWEVPGIPWLKYQFAVLSCASSSWTLQAGRATSQQVSILQHSEELGSYAASTGPARACLHC